MNQSAPDPAAEQPYERRVEALVLGVIEYERVITDALILAAMSAARRARRDDPGSLLSVMHLLIKVADDTRHHELADPPLPALWAEWARWEVMGNSPHAVGQDYFRSIVNDTLRLLLGWRADVNSGCAAERADELIALCDVTRRESRAQVAALLEEQPHLSDAEVLASIGAGPPPSSEEA